MTIKLSGAQSFLAVSTVEPLSYPVAHTVRVHKSLRDVISSWSAGTRVSPLYGMRGFGTEIPLEETFHRRCRLIFAGLLHPAALESLRGQVSRAWLTLGSYNVVVQVSSKRAERRVKALCSQEGARYEIWTLRNSRIGSVEFSSSESLHRWRSAVARSLSSASAPEIVEALREYAPLMASAMARAAYWLPDVMQELALANRYTLDIVNNPDSEIYATLSALISFNAGLSRFTSQAFSGTSPILETECHYWIHSLLGTGTANLALHRIRQFVQSTLGEERLSIRVEKFGSVQGKDMPELSEPDIVDWGHNYIGETKLTDEDRREELFPLITYWSGRDGFRSTVNTLSAPLASISACNSVRWSLMTVTHEISHAIVRGILSQLMPDLDDEDEIAECEALLETRERSENLLIELRKFLLQSCIRLERAEALINGHERNEMPLPHLLDQWHHEVEEIVVHVFDFLYFYRGELDRYVPAIWMSWSVIPNISDRVPEYVLRTLCAAAATFVDSSHRVEEEAWNAVVELLEDEQKRCGAEGTQVPYIDAAVDQLKEHWGAIKQRLAARVPLVRFVRSFLYSRGLAKELGRDIGLTGGRRKRASYTFRPKRFDTTPLRNPLRFLESYANTRRPSAVDSAWMLMVLAFNTDHGNP